LKKLAFHGATSSPISTSPNNRELLGREWKKGQSLQSTHRRILFQAVSNSNTIGYMMMFEHRANCLPGRRILRAF
jgi:hypothetical protein